MKKQTQKQLTELAEETLKNVNYHTSRLLCRFMEKAVKILNQQIGVKKEKNLPLGSSLGDDEVS